MNHAEIQIGGFLKQSLIDYPGHITSVVFTAGCNFRCGYCHNPELVLPERICQSTFIGANEVLQYAQLNKNLLDAITITGGEPTLQVGLPWFAFKIKKLGLKVKLDTNGTNPAMVERLIEEKLVDYIAMDIKAPITPEAYRNVVGSILTPLMLEKVKRTIAIILSSGIDHEFRTTLEAPFDRHLQHKIEASVGEPVTWQEANYGNLTVGNYQ